MSGRTVVEQADLEESIEVVVIAGYQKKKCRAFRSRAAGGGLP